MNLELHSKSVFLSFWLVLFWFRTVERGLIEDRTRRVRHQAGVHTVTRLSHPRLLLLMDLLLQRGHRGVDLVLLRTLLVTSDIG